MSKMRIASQLTNMKRRPLNPERKLALCYTGNCLALTALLATLTNCSATDGNVDATGTGTAVEALRVTPDPYADHPAMVVEDSMHALNWAPNTVYGGGVSTQGSLSMFAVGDPNASVTVSNNQCSPVGSGGWKLVLNTNDQRTACSAQAQTEATQLAASEPDAPAACYVGTGTVETVTCGKQRICSSTYGGGSSCSDVSITMNVCHIKVTRGANVHYTTPFIPIGLEYELPGGNDTSIQHIDTTMQSTAWSITNSGGTTVKANFVAGIFGFGASSSYSFSTTNSGTQSLKTSTGTTRTGSVPFQYHNLDTFSLWINPSINYWTQCSDGAHAVYGLSTDPKAPKLINPVAARLMDQNHLNQDYARVGIMDVEAGWLLKPGTSNDAVYSDFLATAASQIDQLLKMDPFYDPANKTMMGTASLSSDRFVDTPDPYPNCQRNIAVPPNETVTCTIDYTNTQLQTSTKSASYDFNLALKPSFGGLSVDLTAGYTGTVTSSASLEVQDIVRYKGPATGQIAIDTLFHEYVLDFGTGPASAQ